MNRAKKTCFRDMLRDTGCASERYLSQAAELDALFDQLPDVEELEPVPAHMMEMFDDAQWPLLVFELQPTVALYRAEVDLIGLQKRKDAGREGFVQTDGPYQWLIVGRGGELLVRSLSTHEYGLLAAAGQGASFDDLSRMGWPEFAESGRHEAMTTMLLGWLENQLIIDAGVPIPGDAEYEDSPVSR